MLYKTRGPNNFGMKQLWQNLKSSHVTYNTGIYFPVQKKPFHTLNTNRSSPLPSQPLSVPIPFLFFRDSTGNAQKEYYCMDFRLRLSVINLNSPNV